MKRIITFICMLTASVVLADPYVVVFIESSMPSVGFTKVLENIQEIGGDETIIDRAKMPTWCEIADTNITGRVCCIRTDSLGVNRWNKKSLVQARIDIKDGLKIRNKAKGDNQK